MFKKFGKMSFACQHRFYNPSNHPPVDLKSLFKIALNISSFNMYIAIKPKIESEVKTELG